MQGNHTILRWCSFRSSISLTLSLETTGLAWIPKTSHNTIQANEIPHNYEWIVSVHKIIVTFVVILAILSNLQPTGHGLFYKTGTMKRENANQSFSETGSWKVTSIQIDIWKCAASSVNTDFTECHSMRKFRLLKKEETSDEILYHDNAAKHSQSEFKYTEKSRCDYRGYIFVKLWTNWVNYVKPIQIYFMEVTIWGIRGPMPSQRTTMQLWFCFAFLLQETSHKSIRPLISSHIPTEWMISWLFFREYQWQHKNVSYTHG